MVKVIICTPHQLLFGDRSRRMRWAGQVAFTGQENEYRISAGKRDGTRND
jgi:hypothetical protein